MEVIHKVRVEDKTKIKAIKFKFPEIMGSSSETTLKREYAQLIATKSALSEAREVVRQLEKKFANLEKEWNAKKDLFEIEFEATEKEVKTTKSYMTINGKTVYDCNSRR